MDKKPLKPTEITDYTMLVVLAGEELFNGNTLILTAVLDKKLQ